jgi:UDP-3-O-[3-hydroxymyristoyl] N-acetylglucosamine deacetylase
MPPRSQKTLREPIAYSGIGIHTGKKVTMTFYPAPIHSGIVFQRVDLPGKPKIPAAIEYVVDTARCTTIGIGACMVHTVEHVLAALRAFEIDNLLIQLTDCEPPVADGSSKVFVEMILQAGLQAQQATKCMETLQAPVYFSHQNIHLVALPSDEYRISYTLNYPKVPVIRSQFFSVCVNAESFKQEIAPCRTFALYEEISHLMSRGLIKGGSLDNAVVIKDDVILSKEGLRFQDEMVRHKILDVIGDLSLVGFPFLAHIIAIGSGHYTNVEFGKKLLDCMTTANMELT